MSKLAALTPIDPVLTGAIQPGIVVAFREDHETHGATFDGEGGMTASSKYGLIREVGLNKDGELTFNVVTYDPAMGTPSLDDKANYQAGMGEIQ